eukprot:scaffold8376_cov33-Tisochrysis_lutea.AAC.4
MSPGPVACDIIAEAEIQDTRVQETDHRRVAPRHRREFTREPSALSPLLPPLVRIDCGEGWLPSRSGTAAMAEEDEGHGGALEPDEHGLLSEHAVAQAMAQISMLAAENDALRARNAELLREAIATSERAAQLEVEVRGGAHLDGEGEGSTAIEWVDMSARLQLLLTENSVLEADIVATKRALHVAEDGRAKAEEALAEALGATQRARASEEDALTRAAEAQMAVGTARDEAEAAQVDRAQETAKLEAALRELAASRAETAAAVAELGSMRRALDSMRTTAAAAARESEHQLALAADREAAHELRAAALERQLHNLEAVVADKEESVGLRSAELEEMAAQLASTHEQMRLAEAEAASAREEAARADEAAAEANERARVIGEKLERSTQLLERQVASAKAAAEVAARAHSAELAEARRLATETEAELRARAEASEARAEATRAQLSREGRERISLQREIEELRAVAERKERDAGTRSRTAMTHCEAVPSMGEPHLLAHPVAQPPFPCRRGFHCR